MGECDDIYDFATLDDLLDSLFDGKISESAAHRAGDDFDLRKR